MALCLYQNLLPKYVPTGSGQAIPGQQASRQECFISLHSPFFSNNFCSFFSCLELKNLEVHYLSFVKIKITILFVINHLKKCFHHCIIT